jgi:hypothetical protein
MDDDCIQHGSKMYITECVRNRIKFPESGFLLASNRINVQEGQPGRVHPYRRARRVFRLAARLNVQDEVCKQNKHPSSLGTSIVEFAESEIRNRHSRNCRSCLGKLCYSVLPICK